jgi:ubiquinone/menaquinone biosynthesis C-methylase UbiE
MLGQHSYATVANAPTRGRLIRGSRLYDLMANVLTLGRAPAMREEAADLADIRPGESVLEVGCGTGELAQRARARTGPGGTVCGIDPSADMIAVARQKSARRGLGIDYRVAAIESLPFADATFDVVLSSLMMHHLPGDLKAAGLAEVQRVLKPGGRLLILDFKRPNGLLSHLTLASIVHSHMDYAVEDLSALVAAAGFANIKTGDTRFRPVGFLSARVPS